MTKSILTIFSFAVLFFSVPVIAQQSNEFEMQRGDIPQTSGFVDENGNPISIEEFERMRQESQKNIFQRQPVLSAGVIILLVGAVIYFISKKNK